MEERIGKFTITASRSYSGNWGYEVEDKIGEVVESNFGYASEKEALEAGKQCVRENIKGKIFSTMTR